MHWPLNAMKSSSSPKKQPQSTMSPPLCLTEDGVLLVILSISITPNMAGRVDVLDVQWQT